MDPSRANETRARARADVMAGKSASGDDFAGHDGKRVNCRVAFVDNDPIYRAAMTDCLRARGLEVAEYANPTDALSAVTAESRFAILLIDADIFWSMPQELLDKVLEASDKIAVALIAQVRSNWNEEQALKLGAADYLDKSSSPTVVALRLRLLIGGMRMSSEMSARESGDSLEVGPLTLWLNSCGALWRGQQVRLTVTEFRIVCLLAGDPGRDFSYRRIYDVVHGPDFVAGDGPEGHRANVRSLIKKIRKRFRRLDSGFDAIENSAGFGYRWRSPGDPTRSEDDSGEGDETEDEPFSEDSHSGRSARFARSYDAISSMGYPI